MSANRRGFLGLMAAAPIAGPVMAREAASKAGLAQLGGGFSMSGPLHASASASSGSENEWIKNWVRETFTDAWADNMRRDFSSRPVYRLDPDLACSRSLSLAAAMRIQRGRDISRAIENGRSEAVARFKSAFGMDFIP